MQDNWRDYRALAHRYRARRQTTIWDWLTAIAIAGAVWAANAAIKAMQCHLERTRYHEVTGQDVSLWQAWLYDLRTEADQREPSARWRGAQQQESEQ